MSKKYSKKMNIYIYLLYSIIFLFSCAVTYYLFKPTIKENMEDNYLKGFKEEKNRIFPFVILKMKTTMFCL